MFLMSTFGLLHTISTDSLQTNNPDCYVQFGLQGGIYDPSNPQAPDSEDILAVDDPYHAYDRALVPVPEYPPSQKDWESYRGIFTQLYQVEEKPLKAVKELLETQYGFKATERMYKKRIKEWKINKNYKCEEKNAVSRALQRRTQAGKVSHQVMIRNQPVKIQRILRHLKASAGATIGYGSAATSGSLESSEVEVRTPVAESFVLDESTNRHLQAALRRRLSLSPEPSRPLFTHDDLGSAEVLCWESVGYFEWQLSVHARTLSSPKSARDDCAVNSFNSFLLAVSLAKSSRYSDARVILNNSFDELKNALTHQSPQLLPSLLGVICARREDQTPFKVRELYREHAADLCRVYLGVQHPITVMVHFFRGAGGKYEVFNAVLGSLLATVLRKTGLHESHDLPIYLMRLQTRALVGLRQLEEAERILRRALTICTTANGTGHWMTLDILVDLARLNVTCLQNYGQAKVLFGTVLRDTVDEEGEVIEPGIRSNALEGLARVARFDGDLPKAEDLSRQALEVNVKGFGPKNEEAMYLAALLEEMLRAQEKHSEADQLHYLYRLED